MAVIEKFSTQPRTTSYRDVYTMRIGAGATFVENAVTRVDRNSSIKTVITHPTGTPGFDSYLKRHLLLPDNAYSLQIKEDSGTYYSGAYVQRLTYANYFLSKFRTGNAITVGYDTVPVVKHDGDFAQMDRDVVQKILSKIKSQSINTSQAIAERKQVIRMIGDTATKVAAAISAVKHGNLRAAVRELGTRYPGRASRRRIRGFPATAKSAAEVASRTWLELQYGWKPLLSDVFGAVEAMAMNEARGNVNRVSARKVAEFDQASPVTSMSIDDLLVGSSKCTTRRVSSMTIFFSTNTATKPLAELGLTNPAILAWELLPWSFVVDWFIPIGDWINNWDATLGSSFIQGSSSVSLEEKVRYTTSSSGYNGEYFTSVRETREFRFDRNTLFTFPGLQLPRFKNPVSPVHAMNGIALLVQSFRK